MLILIIDGWLLIGIHIASLLLLICLNLAGRCIATMLMMGMVLDVRSFLSVSLGLWSSVLRCKLKPDHEMSNESPHANIDQP